MDDSRECFLEYLRIYPRKKFCVDEEPSEWKNSIHKSVLEAIFRTICAYIRHERDTDKDWKMGKLEREYLCSDDFIEAEDEKKWIEENRETDDLWLIVYIFDNVPRMTPGTHRRALLYLLNILYFDL
tara:strand:- start:14198 stop:14578 length:381 start_codon:yes stop_codon:yes gene_type:complete